MTRRLKHLQADHEEDAHLERWLISYADFITLLFAFFVVMYSISSVNEGKYRVLSDTLEEIFQENKIQPTLIDDNIIPVEIQGKETFIEKPGVIELPIPEQANIDVDIEQDDVIDVKKDVSLDQIEEKVIQKMASLIDANLITVKKNEFWVEVEIKSSILFQSGKAKLSKQATPILSTLAKTLQEYGNMIQVEGFTDNVPINTRQFPSNWELSSSRAASVVHLFMQKGVDPTRMMAIGYGEYRPIASNSTAQGRNKNRRVNIVILRADAQTGKIVRPEFRISKGLSKNKETTIPWQQDNTKKQSNSELQQQDMLPIDDSLLDLDVNL